MTLIGAEKRFKTVMHTTTQKLLAYVRGDLSDSVRLRIETHLAECKECLEQVQNAIYLREHFDDVWSSWTAGEHHRAIRQQKLADALTSVLSVTPALRDEAQAWINQIGQETRAAWRLLLDRTAQITALAQGSMPHSRYTFRLQPAVAGIGSPEAHAEAQKRIVKGSELLTDGHYENAEAELREASKIDVRFADSAEGTVDHSGQRLLDLSVDANRGSVLIKARSLRKKDSGFAVLMPEEEGPNAIVAVFEPIPEESYALVEFRDVPSGRYAVSVSPSVTAV